MITCKNCGRNVEIEKTTREYCLTCYSKLLKNGTLLRLYPECNITTLTQEQHEIMEGSLLGDGGLCARHTTQKAIYKISRKREDVKYLEWNFEKFKEFFYQKIKPRVYFNKTTQKEYYQNYFSSKSCNVFYKYYMRWYPENIKIIPRDIELTPAMLAVWFCDDGNIRYKIKNKLEIKLSTDGFTISDVEWLVNKLQEKYKEYFYIILDKNNPVIYASDYAARLLINDMKNCFPNGMERKMIWKDIPLSNLNHSDHFKQINIRLGVLQVLLQNTLSGREINNLLNVKYTNGYLRKLVSENIIKSINNDWNRKYVITDFGKSFYNKNKNNPLFINF